MRLSITYELHDPTTTSDHAITIKYMCLGTEEEISKIKAYCEENIGALLTGVLELKENAND